MYKKLGLASLSKKKQTNNFLPIAAPLGNGRLLAQKLLQPRSKTSIATHGFRREQSTPLVQRGCWASKFQSNSAGTAFRSPTSTICAIRSVGPAPPRP